jgi:hypothetical protein
MGVFRPRLGIARQNTARTGTVNVEKSLNFVRGAFASLGAHFVEQSDKAASRVAEGDVTVARHYCPQAIPWTCHVKPITAKEVTGNEKHNRKLKIEDE